MRIQEAICASELVLLSDQSIIPLFYNMSVNIYVSMCKSKCANRSKLQFLTFSTSFDTIAA